MLVVFDSLTGNCKKFVNKLPEDFQHCHISEYDGVEPFALVTYTINFGDIPKSTSKFLKENSKKMLAVSSSGNKAWGKNYAKAGEKISIIYNVPLISKFELQGDKRDIEYFIRRVNEVWQDM